MPILHRRFRQQIAFMGLTAALFTSGCIFDSKYRVVTTATQTFTTKNLDTLYPASARVDEVVSIYQPYLDAGLKSNQASTLTTYPPVNIKESGSGKVVQYRVTRQRFGSWDRQREFLWNYSLLQSNFLFPRGLPDTAGFAFLTDSLYGKVHVADAFTNYFDSVKAPSIISQITTSTKSGKIGILVKLSLAGDSVLVDYVVKSSPAGRAGIIAGMAILSVNDSSTVGDSAIERFQRFSLSDLERPVRLTVLGPGARGTETFSLVREPVAFPTVMTDSLQGVGYIFINGFTPNTLDSKSTYTEFRDALIATKKFPVTLIDLRDNGGGSLDVALKMCDEILPAETIIIRQIQRQFDEAVKAPIQTEVTVGASAGGVGEKATDGSARKYLLLANAGSASASEIFLIAVKEGANAPLMGIKTFGKGVGQTVRETPGKGLALVTVLMFTSAANLKYHAIGISPDFPDSSQASLLLKNAVQKALTLSKAPVAKNTAERKMSMLRNVQAVEWNRRQGIKQEEWGLEVLKEALEGTLK